MGKTVKIFCMGDSLTEGDGNPSAYRYPLFERLFRAGADFRFVGPSSSRDDVRLPALYNHHGGNCGYVIGIDVEEERGSLRNNLRKATYSKALEGADIVLLWIGANDYGQNIDIKHIGDRYADLLHVIWGFAPNATVYGAKTLNGMGKEDGTLDRWIDAAPPIFAAEGHRFVPVELSPPDNPLSRLLGDFPENDGHPSEQGNCKIADAWFDAIIDEVRKLNKNGVDDGTAPLVRAESISLVGKVHTVSLGQSLTLKAEVLPENASVKTVLWRSSDACIAEIDRYGRVFPKCQGEVKITAETLDGGHTAEYDVTVSGISDMSLGMTKIYVSDLTNEAMWSGDVDKISKKFNKFQVRYQGKGFELTAENFRVNSERLMLNFTHRTANHGSRDRNNYSSVKLGALELRICALASVIELYENGRLAGEYTGVPISAMNDKFSLLCEHGKARVFRNGELLFDAELEKKAVSGTLMLYWHELYAKSELKNIEVYV